MSSRAKSKGIIGGLDVTCGVLTFSTSLLPPSEEVIRITIDGIGHDTITEVDCLNLSEKRLRGNGNEKAEFISQTAEHNILMLQLLLNIALVEGKTSLQNFLTN